MRDLHADRRRQAVAHGAEPARGHPAVRLLEAEELRRPHLVLADFGGDVDVAAARRLEQPLDRVLRQDDIVVLLVGQRIARAPFRDLLPPGRISGFFASALNTCSRSPSTLPASPMIGMSTRMFLLIEDGSISMWIFFEPGENASVAPGDAVVEARADAQHDVAAMHRHVGLVGAVHAEHAEPVLARRRIGAEPHQGRGDRKAGDLDQLAQQFRGFGSGIDDAAAASRSPDAWRRRAAPRLCGSAPASPLTRGA